MEAKTCVKQLSAIAERFDKIQSQVSDITDAFAENGNIATQAINDCAELSKIAKQMVQSRNKILANAKRLARTLDILEKAVLECTETPKKAAKRIILAQAQIQKNITDSEHIGVDLEQGHQEFLKTVPNISNRISKVLNSVHRSIKLIGGFGADVSESVQGVQNLRKTVKDLDGADSAGYLWNSEYVCLMAAVEDILCNTPSGYTTYDRIKAKKSEISEFKDENNTPEELRKYIKFLRSAEVEHVQELKDELKRRGEL